MSAPDNLVWHSGTVAAEQRWAVTGGRGVTVWITGLSGSGKSTIAFRVESALVDSGRAAYVLDGDNLRHGLNRDLGFSPDAREENVRRVAELATLMADAGLVVLVPIISPYRRDRAAARRLHQDRNLPFVEVFVDTPLEVCETRDPKGLYRKARAGEISEFTGVSAPYEPPISAELSIDTTLVDLTRAVEMIVAAT